MRTKFRNITPRCACGCGKPVTKNVRSRGKRWNIYIFGHSSKGRPKSEEQKQKISKTLKGNVPTPEACANISKALKGRVFTDDWKRKLSIKSKGANNAMWKGGRYVSDNGYVFLYVPDHPNNIGGYVQEHRLVMEKILGRHLTSIEVVHHKNEVHDDNVEENLQLFANQSEHIKYHKFWLQRKNMQ